MPDQAVAARRPQLATLYGAGLQDADIARLVALRRRVEAERRAEAHLQQRLAFIKYLVDTGRVHD